MQKQWSAIYLNRDEFDSFRATLHRCDRLSCRGGTFGFHFFECVESPHWTARLGCFLEAMFEHPKARKAMTVVFCLALCALICDLFLPKFPR